jgi:hypothetical protein
MAVQLTLDGAICFPGQTSLGPFLFTFTAESSLLGDRPRADPDKGESWGSHLVEVAGERMAGFAKHRISHWGLDG